MLDIGAGNVICQIVNEFLRRGDDVYDDSYTHKTSHGVVVTLFCSMSHYTEKYNYNVQRQVVMLFTGNTSVFMAVSPPDDHYPSWRNVPRAAWENTSNHDSCWRSDGVNAPLSSVYFSMATEINNSLKEQGEATVAPAAMHNFNHLGTRLAEGVEVTTTTDSDSHNPSYFRKITNIVLGDNDG